MYKKTFALLLCLLLAVPSLPQMLLSHPWQGKRVAYLGDSITDPRNSGSKKKYWGFLQDWLQITPYVYGISGRQWNDIPRQADKCFEEHGDSVDAIIIFVGTNDYNAGVPIGEWFEEIDTTVVAAIHKPKAVVKRKMRRPLMTKDTYRGRINIALSTLKGMYPTKQIVILTPIHRALAAFNDKNWQPTEAYQNECGEFFDEYVESVKEAGEIWAMPVIDTYSLSGLYPLEENQGQYFHIPTTDRLHPNDKGHERLARTLFYQLMALPCVF